MNRIHFDVAPAPDLDPQIGLLLAMLDDGTGEWRGELADLGELDEDAIVWQPYPDGHNIGAVLFHIADVEAFWLHELAAGQARSPEELKALLSEETAQYEGRWPIPPRKPLGWYYEQLDRTRQRTHALVRGLDDPTRVSNRKERTFTLRWILHHVIAHEAYHAGQVVLLALQHEKNRP